MHNPGFGSDCSVKEGLVMVGILRIDWEESDGVLRRVSDQDSNNHRNLTNTSLNETVILPLPSARSYPQLYMPLWQVVQLVAADKPGVGGTGFGEGETLEER